MRTVGANGGRVPAIGRRGWIATEGLPRTAVRCVRRSGQDAARTTHRTWDRGGIRGGVYI